LLFLAYLGYQYYESLTGDNSAVEYHLIQTTKKAIESGDKSLVEILREYYQDDFLRPGGRLATSRKIGEIPRFMKKMLQDFFKRFDADKDKKLDLGELSTLMKLILPEPVWNSSSRGDKIHELMGYLDTDDCGRVSMKEFVAKAPEFIVRRREASTLTPTPTLTLTLT